MNDMLVTTIVLVASAMLLVATREEVIAWYFFAVLMLLGTIAFVVAGFLISDLESGVMFGGVMFVYAICSWFMGFMSAPARSRRNDNPNPSA
jgi:hypothetical protein